MNLSYCPHCKENSVIIKKKKISESRYSRIEYCVNKGCDYKQKLPDVKIGHQ